MFESSSFARTSAEAVAAFEQMQLEPSVTEGITASIDTDGGLGASYGLEYVTTEENQVYYETRGFQLVFTHFLEPEAFLGAGARVLFQFGYGSLEDDGDFTFSSAHPSMEELLEEVVGMLGNDPAFMHTSTPSMGV